MKKTYIIPSLYVKTVKPNQMIAASPGFESGNAGNNDSGVSDDQTGGGNGLAKQGGLDWGNPDEE